MRNAIISKATWLKSRPFLIGALGLTGLVVLYLGNLYRPEGLSARENGLAPPITDFLTGIAASRAPAALVAILCVAILYYLLQRWHSHRVAVMTSVLFATSGWMLHTGRLATPLILYSLVPLALFFLISWFATTKRSARGLIIVAVVYAMLLQINGAIWFELASAVLAWPIFVRHLQNVKSYVPIVAGSIGAAGVGIVIIRLLDSPETITRWFGAHEGLPGPVQFLDQWAHSVSFIFRGPEAADLWLGHAPLLDAFTIGLLLLGMIIYLRSWHNLRVQILATYAIIATLLIGLSGITGISYLVPLIYLVAGCGLNRLLREWYAIFPRNPVARWLGTGVVVVTVALACSYHLSAYFVAWQQSPATLRAFSRQP